MRISDWSSDVCSSDLVFHIHDAWDAKAWPAHLQRHHRELVERADLIITTADNMSRELPGIGPGGALVLPMGSISTPSRPVRGNPVRPTSRQFRTREIGRASCRESVCTSVEISVGAVTLKK